jgi:hypothetical protein
VSPFYSQFLLQYERRAPPLANCTFLHGPNESGIELRKTEKIKARRTSCGAAHTTSCLGTAMVE